MNPCGDPPVAVGGRRRRRRPKAARCGARTCARPADPVALDGTVLRVDPATGAGAAGQSARFSTDANARRIIAHGFRNPFRITVRPGTNEFWVGDVGWSDWEEIDRIPNPTDGHGRNFGWPCYEGGGRQSATTAPTSTSARASTRRAARRRDPDFTYNHSAPRSSLATAARPGAPRSPGWPSTTAATYPVSLRRRAVLRRLLAPLHLGDARSCGRPARPGDATGVHPGGGRSRRRPVRARRRALLCRLRRGHDSSCRVRRLRHDAAGRIDHGAGARSDAHGDDQRHGERIRQQWNGERRPVPARRRRPRRRGHVRAVRVTWDTRDGDERPAHADRGRAGRDRKHGDVDGRVGHREQPGTPPPADWSPRTGSTSRRHRPPATRPATETRGRWPARPGPPPAGSAARCRSTASTTGSPSRAPPRSTSPPAMTLEAWVSPAALSSWRTVLLKEQPGVYAYALYARHGPERAERQRRHRRRATSTSGTGRARR